MRALPPGKSTWSLRTSSDTSQTPCGSHVGCAPDRQILRPCIHVGAVNLLLRITDEVRADAPLLDFDGPWRAASGRMRMVGRMLPADVGSAWLCETVR